MGISIGVAVVVIVAVVIGVVASGGKKKHSSTTPTTLSTSSQSTATTSPATTSPATTTATTVSASGSAGSQEPSLLSVAPSSFSGHCTTQPSRVASSALDEIDCITVNVSQSGADVVGYVRFPDAASVNSYFSSVLSLNGLSSGKGDCSTGSLSGTSSTGTYCVSNYTDSDDNSGTELIFVGSGFQFGGGSDNTTQAACSSLGGSGASVLLWTSPTDESVGLAFDCTTTGTYAQQMQTNLTQANYVLND